MKISNFMLISSAYRITHNPISDVAKRAIYINFSLTMGKNPKTKRSTLLRLDKKNLTTKTQLPDFTHKT